MQESMSPFDQMTTILRPDNDTPFRSRNVLQVTAEELAGIRAFIRELKPGIYIKCSACERFTYNNDAVSFRGDGGVYCKGCA